MLAASHFARRLRGGQALRSLATSGQGLTFYAEGWLQVLFRGTFMKSCFNPFPFNKGFKMKRHIILGRTNFVLRAFFWLCCLALGPIVPPVMSATITLPPQGPIQFTKATVQWPKLSATSTYAFAVACGKMVNICASVTPARLTPKFSWLDPAGILTITPGTDPSCNGGRGGFLTIEGPATGCSSGVQTISAKLNGKVVSTTQGALFDIVGTLTPNDNFTGRNQDKYGIAEKLTLAATISPSGLSATDIGGLQWSFSGVGSLPIAGTDGTGSYDAGGVGGNVTLQLSVIAGPSSGFSKTYPKTVIIPAGEYMVQATGTNIWHVQNTASVGFMGSSFVLPKDVSFSNIQRREGTATGTGTGFYSVINGLVHSIGTWFTVSGCNTTTGCSVNNVDTVQAGARTGPYSSGDFTWPIPREYMVGAGAATPYFIALHHQYVDVLGTCCIEKAGAGPFCKQAADPSSSYY